MFPLIFYNKGVMKYFSFILRSSLEDLRRNKLRTLLTSLGILIGIASVVLLTAFGLGLKKYIEDQFNSLGSNLIMVMPGKFSTSNAQSAMTASGKFDDKDVINLKKIKTALRVIPAFVKNSKISSGGNAATYELIASTEDIFIAMNFEAEYGKLFDKATVTKGSKVIVLGSKPAEKILGGVERAVGKIVKVEDQAFKVIGVLKSKGGGMGGQGMDDHVFIPSKAALTFNPSKKYYALYVQAKDKETVDETKLAINKTLLDRYDKDDFTVTDQKEILNTLSSIFDMLNMVLVGIAAISLVVGGVGVMNIMYVSVAERVQEIGVRRAVGANDHDILYLFVAESVILSIIGGIMGLSLSYLVVALIQPIFPAYIDLKSVLLALGVSTTIGVVFGVFPAKKASNLSPIEAIRKE